MFKLSRLGIGRSLFLTITAVSGLCTALAVGFIYFASLLQTQETARQNLINQADQVTRLVADQTGGAIKFGKEDVLNLLFQDTIRNSHGQVALALAVNSDGMIIASTVAEENAPNEMHQLAMAAISEGGFKRSEDGLSVAAVSRFGKDNLVVGAVAFKWTTGNALANHQDEMLKSALLSGAVLLLSLILAGLIFRAWISRPLTDAVAIMKRLGENDWQTEIPQKRRRDEIGTIWKALGAYRDVLESGATSKAESDFKSAAFQGSSAAMMIVDIDLVVRYLNPGMQSLLNELTEELTKLIDDFVPSAMVGKKLDTRLANGALGQNSNAGLDRFPFTSAMALGERRLELNFNAVVDDTGNQQGIVIEWNDVTADWLNKAILEAIDRDQITAEFTPDGRCVSVNAQFSTLSGKPVEKLSGMPLSSLLRHTAENGSMDQVLSTVIATGAAFGKFELVGPKGEPTVIEGSITCVTEQDGSPMRLMLICQDITEAEEQLRQERNERRRLMDAQGFVVNAIQAGLEKLSNGDLTAVIDVPFDDDHDALRTDFNSTVQSLAKTIGLVAKSAESIRNEAAEISKTADTLSRKTENTAATLEETAVSLDQLTQSVKTAAEGASQAEVIVKDAKDKAEYGGDVIVTTVDAMDCIAESSVKIASIINVIDDIAFQTNLLALNAGVEAARAGDAGRGFAVVASEVRALAQRSSDAAREINGLIADSGKQVKRGVDLVGKTGEALKEIVNSVSEISQHVSRIAESSLQQSSGLMEINSAVANLDRSTQQNAARFEETTAASHALTNDAIALAKNVARFSVPRAGNGSSVVPLHRPEKPEVPRSGKAEANPEEISPSPDSVGEVQERWVDF